MNKLKQFKYLKKKQFFMNKLKPCKVGIYRIEFLSKTEAIGIHKVEMTALIFILMLKNKSAEMQKVSEVTV